MAERRLYRSRHDRMLWGVCGGLAKYFNVDPVLVRIIFVLSIFINGLGILAYLILAIVIPNETSRATEPSETIKENAAEIKETAVNIGNNIRREFGAESREKEDYSYRNRTIAVIGLIILVIGVIVLLANLNIFWWFHWSYVWPAVLIIIGLLIIFTVRRR